MILGNFGIRQTFSPIHTSGLTLCNRGKTKEFPCIFPAYQGILAYIWPIFKEATIHKGNKIKI